MKRVQFLKFIIPIYIVIIFGLYMYDNNTEEISNNRRLGTVNFTDNSMSKQTIVIVNTLILLYTFLGLAVICDDHFCESLEGISTKFKLSDDVAGATFMAAGSSAPELFICLADNVFNRPETTIGVSTIVGSAIFNILIIISAASFFAGKTLKIDWRPLTRDSFWYTISIIELGIFTWDGKVEFKESTILFLTYVGYIINMIYNQRIFKYIEKINNVSTNQTEVNNTTIEIKVQRYTEEDFDNDKNAPSPKRPSISRSRSDSSQNPTHERKYRQFSHPNLVSIGSQKSNPI